MRLLALIIGLIEFASPAWSDTALLREMRSRDGVLEARITAAPATVAVDRVSFPGMVFNGQYAGPVLRVVPGDLLRVRFENRLAEPSNLHFHGIETSPRGNGDNVAIVVPPGGDFTYEVAIPPSQPPGLYWYHAHMHGHSERQVMGGLSGLLIVEGIERQVPVLAGMRERLFVLKDYVFDDTDDPVIEDELHNVLQTINGATRQTIEMLPGETQLWRLSNQSANLYFHLALQGHRFRVIAEDGVTRSSPEDVERLSLKPAARVDVLVTAGQGGRFDLVSEKILTGAARSRSLAEVVVSGSAAAPLIGKLDLPALHDLRLGRIDRKRSVTFSQSADTTRYMIDGRTYDHDRIDVSVPLGNVEEWTIRNDTDDVHSFHIHQVHFQVIAVNGRPQEFNALADTVRVPERGSITLLIPFNNPDIAGRFVFHCHVLKHEDRGMMANIEVVRRGAAAPLDALLRYAQIWRRRIDFYAFALATGLPAEWCEALR